MTILDLEPSSPGVLDFENPIWKTSSSMSTERYVEPYWFSTAEISSELLAKKITAEVPRQLKIFRYWMGRGTDDDPVPCAHYMMPMPMPARGCFLRMWDARTNDASLFLTFCSRNASD
jgi:hypothetical protein